MRTFILALVFLLPSFSFGAEADWLKGKWRGQYLQEVTFTPAADGKLVIKLVAQSSRGFARAEADGKIEGDTITFEAWWGVGRTENYVFKKVTDGKLVGTVSRPNAPTRDIAIERYE